MALSDEAAKSERIERVLRLVHERLPAEHVSLTEIFVRDYFSQVDAEDLGEREVFDLYGAALSHLNFARRFQSGAPKLRVYNPRLEEHGWQSAHTIVEMVNDDMPFLVDSITMEVNRQGLTLHLIIHPVMEVKRDVGGALVELKPKAGGRHESLIHVEVDRRSDPVLLGELQAGIQRILDDVRATVADWQAMRARLDDIIATLASSPPPLDQADIAEDTAFLRWIADSHFTFIGYREYDLMVREGDDALRIVAGSGLGILRETGERSESASFAALPANARAQARALELLIVTKANSRSPVHRPGYLDYIGVKRFDESGNVVGEQRFLGLYTSTAYNARPADIPWLRRKVAIVIERAGFRPGSHAAKTLLTILEQYPRDELFQISAEELLNTVTGILRLGNRQRTRLFVRRDPYDRFLSCLIYVPRENYNTELRQRMQESLMRAFNGVSSEFTVQLSESALARILMVIRTRPGGVPDYDVRALEARLARAARRWRDDLHQALAEHGGEEQANRFAQRYRYAFPAGYVEDYSARNAVLDIALMESLDGDDLAMNLYAPLEAPAGSLRFKIFHAGAPVTLSRSMPMLEHLGVTVLEERPYQIEPEGAAPIWIHDFGMTYSGEFEIHAVRDLFHDAFARVWSGEIENDDFNKLVLRARLAAADITVLRAYCKYLRQARFTFRQAYMEQALAAHPAIARALIELFHLRFDPTRDGNGEIELVKAINASLEKVENLDEDRILRQFLAVILATIRTNYFQRGGDGKPKAYLSFKLDSARVPGLPEPKPMFEIFVYSPRVEAVHLRGGKVARGGLRWSERMEDFRTEVLGLVKAQRVKNAVIVPVGSKGGFVVKNPPPATDREAFLKEGIACYQTFLRGMLDITDNLLAGSVVPPRSVKRLDGDDPYLVVAADKGTATFSDIANAIAADYGYWLGDAFASGGSAGYDHKKMGITARGAWESVKRHFRELGVNTQEQDFTVVGIGDMSGDVFGNGMLLSEHIKLVAAFDHRQIFLDPDPDPRASFAERNRMFALPRSSWADYDAKLISSGGGVYTRSAKSIALSPEVKQALAIAADALDPNDLINALLKAPVDLLYNGGIGTYVKASTQTHAEVGDRANDAIRVDGNELRCRVAAEGGNLGFTQLGRIEYALRGGKINTDAIDNSGGVDCSDHEVNIKILLNDVVTEGELTIRQRDHLLAEMTEEVGQLVLRDNYFQAQSLSVSGAHGAALLDAQQRFIRALERKGKLNRELEFLPSDEVIAERKAAKMGLTSPERAVLLAYAKLTLSDELIASSLPEDPYFAGALERYFPAPLRSRYRDHIARHPLRREIICTHVTNSMINRVGGTFVHWVREETGARPDEVVRAYLLTREVFDLVSLWKSVEALDNQVADATQTAMLTNGERLASRGTRWFLRNTQYQNDIERGLSHFAPGVAAIAGSLDTLLAQDDAQLTQQAQARLTSARVPPELAKRVAGLDALIAALDIVEVASGSDMSIESVARIYFALSGRLQFGWLRGHIALLPADSHWQTLAKAALRDDLANVQRKLTCAVVEQHATIEGADALIKAWENRSGGALERSRQVITDLQSGGAPDLAMLSVALRELRALT
ncbi:MAG: NAD-glutamate dehydrogenase [Burkholderiales bacterium]|nr:NAD-glutamate dehydrogenase [Burkholderiales bacterium]